MVETRQKSILMLPWLGHGHISPFLELAKKLTLRNFHIYFCSTPVNLNSIKRKLSQHPNNSSSTTSIQLVELHLPSLPDLPPRHHTTIGLPQHLIPTLIKALHMARPNLSNIIETLRPDLIIYDVFPLWTPDLASSLNVPSVAFIIIGAAYVSYMFHQLKNKYDDHDHHDFPFPEISTDYLRTKFAIFRKYPPFVDEHGRDTTPLGMYHKSCNIILIKGLREIEGKYMDYLSVSFGKKIVSVGTLVPNPINDDDDEAGSDIIKWLDKKEKSSTVFVCFGSEFCMSKEDMEEMAHGLEMSNVNFIWVVRFQEGEKMKVEDGLPDGFLGRVREKGMVVENWAPQLKILNHASIGGFVSHCGFSSFMESIKFGVPIIAMPRYVDQPWNARVAEVSGIALEMKRDSINGRLHRENVAKVIRQVVVEENGKDIRRKAKELSEEIKKKGDVEFDDEVVKQLLQLL